MAVVQHVPLLYAVHIADADAAGVTGWRPKMVSLPTFVEVLITWR
jgi:hypothetical protein